MLNQYSSEGRQLEEKSGLGKREEMIRQTLPWRRKGGRQWAAECLDVAHLNYGRDDVVISESDSERGRLVSFHQACEEVP